MDILGRAYRFAALPMGYKLSPYHFYRLMDVVTRYPRTPPLLRPALTRGAPRAREVTARGPAGVRMLPYVDDFLFLAASRRQAFAVALFNIGHVDHLGAQRPPHQGFQEPTQRLEHLGLIIDSSSGRFFAPPDKLSRLAALARDMLCAASRRERSVPAKRLAALAGKAQFLYLAIPTTRFYLRDLHSVLASRTSWTGSVKLTRQLIRDLGWWAVVPSVRNGRAMFREVETATLHTDSSGFSWGAVLNQTHEARGNWSPDDVAFHITWKELRAVRLGVHAFLPYLANRRVLMHEDLSLIHI